MFTNTVYNKYGHCFYCICKEKNCSAIYNLYVEKKYRKKGNGKELLNSAISKVRDTGYLGQIKIVAEPEEDSISKRNLINFYKKSGLKVVPRYHN